MSVSRAMWEVDPETRRKLTEIQKLDGNNVCCDCGAPAPQWASPKFGIFMCLSCAGIHRGLGVHISFVRSVSMDAFKAGEILRMQQGGNNAWKEFFEEHEDAKMQGLTWEDTTIADRYSGSVGEEYKERLTAKIEEREYVPGVKSKEEKAAPANARGGSKPTSNAGSRSSTPLGARDKRVTMGSTSSLRSDSPASSLGTTSLNPSRKAHNENYFAKMGAENASRPEDVPPNQGGKYGGFGSGGYDRSQEPAPQETALPGVDEFTKDPVAALTKGFGWFTTTVGKGAKTVNEDWIQPTAQKLAETDLTPLRQTAAQISQTVSSGVNQGANFTADTLNRFVDPEGQKRQNKGAGSKAPLEKQDFWDSFGASDEPVKAKPSAASGSVGTSAIKKSTAKKDEAWDDF